MKKYMGLGNKKDRLLSVFSPTAVMVSTENVISVG